MELAVVALRWFQFAGAVTLFGATLFQVYSPLPPSRPATRRTRLLPAIAALVLALSTAAGLFAQTAMMAGSASAALDPAVLSMVVTGTSLGMGYAVRLAVAVLAAVILTMTRGRTGLVVAVLLGAVAAGSFAMTGHAAASTGAIGPVHLAADALHAAAAGAWLGALAAFLVMLAPGPSRDAASLHRALAGFAAVGTAAVSVLIVSGLVNVVAIVGWTNLPRLLTALWGWLLLAKLAVFLAMLALAAANRFRLTPALGARIEPDSDPRAAVSALRLSLILETALGAALLAIVAIMGVLPPPGVM